MACRDDSYMAEPALPTVEKIRLYYDSLMRFEGTTSPYIYPLYGLGELPQARLASLTGSLGGFFCPCQKGRRHVGGCLTELSVCVAGICTAECSLWWNIHAE
jgi:hypothetical protein